MQTLINWVLFYYLFGVKESVGRNIPARQDAMCLFILSNENPLSFSIPRALRSSRLSISSLWNKSIASQFLKENM